MAGPNGAIRYVLDTPYLVILEAKKSDTLGSYSSDAELLGQMRVLLQRLYTPLHRLLTSSNDNGRTGILSDGFVWKVFHLDSQFRLYMATFRTETRKNVCVGLVFIPCAI